MSSEKSKPAHRNIDLAFGVYCEMGGQVSRTLAELERRGLRIGPSKLRRWMKKYGFEHRRVQVEEGRQGIGDARLSIEESILRDLLKQKARYEAYFDSIEGIDNQAQFAYANIIKAVVDIARKIKPSEARDPEEVERMAREIFENEYGITV